MKPAPFDYVAPATLDDAIGALATAGDDAKILAGGQSLIPMLALRLARPAVLVDINRLRGLDGIREGAGILEIGALVRQRALERWAAGRSPLFAEVLQAVAHPPIRNRGTVVGNIVHADPASELPAIALALGARFHARTATQQRWIAASDFFVSALTTDLKPDEMLVEIELPSPKPRTGCCFMEIARRRGDFAIVGVAAMMTLGEQDECADVRLSFCGVGETPVDASSAANVLVGRAPSEDAIRDVAAIVQTMIAPNGSVHATADYQRHIAGVLTERALQTAYARGRDGH